MCRRTDGEQVHAEVLAESRPMILREALLGMPAHGESGLPIRHPGPVDALVNLRGQRLGRRAFEILAHREDAVHEERGIDRGHFAFADALAGGVVHPVVEEAVFLWHLFPEELQGAGGAGLSLLARDPAPLSSDTEGRKAKAGGGDARANACRFAVGRSAIGNEASLRLRQLMKEIEGPMLQIFQESLIGQWVFRDGRGAKRGSGDDEEENEEGRSEAEDEGSVSRLRGAVDGTAMSCS